MLDGLRHDPQRGVEGAGGDGDEEVVLVLGEGGDDAAGPVDPRRVRRETERPGACARGSLEVRTTKSTKLRAGDWRYGK